MLHHRSQMCNAIHRKGTCTLLHCLFHHICALKRHRCSMKQAIKYYFLVYIWFYPILEMICSMELLVEAETILSPNINYLIGSKLITLK